MTCYGVVVLVFSFGTLVPANPFHVKSAKLSLQKTTTFLDITLPTPALIKKDGYPVNVYSVTTEDGYILEMHRIPYSPKSPAAPNKPIVFVQHGLMGSSSDWVLMGPNSNCSLAYILADVGYDVWLGNSRGNTYSKRHVKLDPVRNERQFWDFSFHELGMFDIPAAIDHVLKETGQPNLFYIGYSQGTTQFYVMASEKPEYNAKIRAMMSLAPIAYVSNVEDPVLQVLAQFQILNKIAVDTAVGYHEFAAYSPIFALLGMLCTDGQPMQTIVAKMLFLSGLIIEETFNKTMLPVILGHTPGGSSTKMFLHFKQEVYSAKFRNFDYGMEENVKKYGTPSPPSYNMSKITAPVSVYYGKNDGLSSPKDVAILYKKLVNPIGKFLVPYPKFNHASFVAATDVRTVLYDQVIELMGKY